MRRKQCHDPVRSSRSQSRSPRSRPGRRAPRRRRRSRPSTAWSSPPSDRRLEIGADILRQGGNAIDAAVGGRLRRGGDQSLLRQPRRRRIPRRPSRGDQPRHIHRLPRDRAGGGDARRCISTRPAQPIKGASLDGWRAVATPGTVLGLDAALKEYGTMSRAKVMAPAIALARDGFVLSRADADIFQAFAPRFKGDPEAAKIFLRPDGSPLEPGDRLVQSDLAATLQAIADQGPDAFYRGAIAQRIDAAMRANGGDPRRRRPRRLSHRRGRAARLRLSRLSLRLGPAALFRRRDLVRDSQRPRRLRPRRARLPFGRKRPSDGRGDAPRLHGPQHLSRRPGLRQQSARPPAEQGLRGAHPRRDPARQGDAVAARFSPASRRTRRARRPIFR